MNRRETIAAASRAMRERNDCAVRAVTVVTGLDYEVVHAEYRKLGRRRGCGARTTITLQVLDNLGFRCKDVQVKAKTIRTLQQSRELPLFGNFLVKTTSHMTGVSDRAFLDWATTTVKRVRQVWEIVKR
jgi:hypothetical protein